MADEYFVGRDEHIKAILGGDEADQATGHAGTFFDVEGIPGIGKTSLLDKLASEAKTRRGIAIRIDGEGFPARGRAPSFDAAGEFQQFRALLRQALESLHDYDDISKVLEYLTLHSPRRRPGVEGSSQSWMPSDPAEAMRRASQLLDLAAGAVTDLVEKNLAPARTRLLLLVDDFHLLASEGRPLGQWAMQWLDGCKGADVIIAHQQVHDRTSLGLPSRAVMLPLRNLDYSDVEAYLQSRPGVGPDVGKIVGHVWNFTGGHPQALALVADLIKESSNAENAVEFVRQLDAVQGGMPSRLEALVNRILDAIDDEDLRDALYSLCVVRHFDRPLLKSVLGDLTDRHAQTIIDQLRQYSFVDPGTVDRPFLTISDFVCRSGENRLDADGRQEIHMHAAEYYEDRIAKEAEEDDTSYESWLRYERPEFQNLERDWLYHLSSLTGSQRQKGRIGIARIFLDAFWWWGYYIPFAFCEEILADWASATSGDAEDRGWGAALRTLNDRYPKGWKKSDVPAQQWTEVRRALRYIWVRGGFDETPLAKREMRHIRGILDFFLADAARYVDPADREADKRLDDAAEQFTANEDEWNLAWVELYRADLAVSREQAEQAISLAKKSAADHPDLDDHELLANLHRVCADALWLREDPAAALDAYARAVLHAYWFQVKIHPDDYTDAFQREMIDRSIDRLAAWHADDQDQAHAALRSACTRIRAFFGPYWREVGAGPPAGEPDVVRALDENRRGDLAAALFPASPTIAELNRPGSEFELIGKDVAYQMEDELAEAPGSPLAPADGAAG
jgi:hypothetical protein